MGAVRPPPREIALDRSQRIAVLQGRPHRCDQRVQTVGTPDLGHPLDHAAAEAPPATLGSDRDSQRAEDGRRRRFWGESRLDHRVESPVGKTRCVSVPRCGNRVPDADDLLALVIPGVEKELRVLGNHAPEQSLQDGPLVHERRVRSRKALRVREFAGPLGTRREVESHVRRSVARPTRPCHQPRVLRQPAQGSFPNTGPAECLRVQAPYEGSG